MLLNKHNLEVEQVCSKKDSRGTIQGVHITKEYTEATDGNVLLRVTLPDVEDNDFPNIPDFELSEANGQTAIIRKETAKDLSKSIPKKVKHLPILEHVQVDIGSANGEIKAAVTNLDTHQVKTCQTIVGEYPDMDKTIPKTEASFTIDVDAKRLAEVLSIASKYNSSTHEVVMEFRPHPEPLVIRANNRETGQRLLSLLVPLKIGE